MTSNAVNKLLEMALDIKEDVVETFAPSDNPRCELCGAKKYQTKRLPYECRSELYNVDCDVSGCNGYVPFFLYTVEVGDDIPIQNVEVQSRGCMSENCDGPRLGYREIAADEEPVETDNYALPLKGMITTKIDQHHTSYVPEETMLLCSQCHSKVHHDDSFRPDLRPDMKRKEWEAMKDD